MFKYFPFVLLIFSTYIYAQNTSVISGVVVNQENNQPLPFASISLKNYPIGTISNENGAFDFYIPKSKRLDTISVSFIGFNNFEIPVSIVDGKLNITLQPSSNVLDEVLLSPLSPLDYIKKAIENLKENYPQDAYQTIAYYREKFVENGAVINKEEGIFKTYYPSSKDTIKNQHQLLLYKPEEDPKEFQFMREWYEKKQEKQKKKAIKKGEEFEEDEFDTDIDLNLGGPETVINLDINRDLDHYLKPKYFKKYEYSFGEETSLNGEQIVTINFKSKGKVDHKRDQGKILISRENFAIVRIEQSGKFSVPFIIKPVLFLVGLKIGNPTFTRVISYQQYKDIWYPKLFRWDADIKLTKRHTFSANEESNIKVGQVFFINKIDIEANTIEKEKIFDTDKDIEEQIYNDLNISWEGMNAIKD